MTKDTKAEILIVAAAAALIAWLWHNNATAGAGTGLEQFPQLSPNAPGTPPGATLFDVPAPVAGYDPNIVLQPWSLPPFNLIMGGGQASSCNCASESQAQSTFGGNADLTAWLASTLNPTQIGEDANSWY